MVFQQPTTLAQALQELVGEVLRGKTIDLTFSSEDEVSQFLNALEEVVQSRQVTVLVYPVGRRTLEVTLPEGA